MPDDPLLLPNPLIAGRYAVDTSQVLLDAGAGIQACLARDRQAGDAKRVALAVSRDAPPRARHLRMLADPIDNLMVPLGHGIAPLADGKGEGYFIVCTAPPGPPLSAPLNAWTEKPLLDLVLRPIAQVLEVLQSRHLTHRAIRPNNVFQAAPGQLVMLGAAYAAPPAMHQPAVFESPYTAMCHPAGRGDGAIADDIYALGVLLVTLAGGKVPMAKMDDATIVRWKLDLGSFPALTRDLTLSSSMAELLRGMLADDPDHRPTPSALLDLGHLRGRRIAARPARRSQRPLMLNDIAVFDARVLAHALLGDRKKAVQFLRNGLLTQWLRRALGDAGMAAQIEDLVRARIADPDPSGRGDSTLIMHAISAMNPRMPLCWRGVALWPDGLPALLAEGIAAKTDLLGVAEELLVNDIAGRWESAKTAMDPSDLVASVQNRHLIQGGGSSGALRLFYSLNPILPCRSPSAGKAWVMTVADLMRLLERAAATAGESLIDPDLVAFIVARTDRKLELQINAFVNAKDSEGSRLAELVLLRDLQTKYHPLPMPALARWVAGRLGRDMQRWRNRSRREALQQRLNALAEAGILSRLLALTGDTASRALDLAGARRAANDLALIDAEVAMIDGDDIGRFANAERLGQTITGGLGLSAFILAILSVVLR